MTSRRGPRRGQGQSSASEKPSSPGDAVHRAMADAAARWGKAARGTHGEAAVRAFEESAPIVAKHWSAMLDRIWAVYAEPPKKRDLQAVQRELHLSTVTSLNAMAKEIMGTPSFSALAGESVGSYLKAKIASDRVLEEMLRAIRIPTRMDIDDLHASLNGLSQKMDRLLAAKPPVERGAVPEV